jgi:hypothetical protein
MLLPHRPIGICSLLVLALSLAAFECLGQAGPQTPQTSQPATLVNVVSGSIASPDAPVASARHYMTPLDWVIIAAYGLGMLAVGWYYARRSQSRDDYLLSPRCSAPSPTWPCPVR